MKNSAIQDSKFQPVGTATLDSKQRIVLTKAIRVLTKVFGRDVENVSFSISLNSAGQILLSPQASIPIHEAWLYRNEVALSSVLRGIEQAHRGELEPMGPFKEFLEDEDR